LRFYIEKAERSLTEYFRSGLIKEGKPFVGGDMALEIDKLITRFEEACRQGGLRLTPQRLEIFTELARSTDHPSAEVLYQRLLPRLSMLSLDTVYRALGTFVELGVATRVETCESQGHFEVSVSQHHHLICRKCGKITDFDWELMDNAEYPVDVNCWGAVERKNIILYGVCRDCLSE
jgi:Fur family peroxide stress response transcriptional regulator